MLKLSKNAGLTNLVSDANPIETSHPTSGSTQTVQLWAFNDDSAVRYEGVTVDPTDAIGSDDSAWVSLSLDNSTFQPAGAVLTIGNLATANTPVTFYAKVTTPSGQAVSNKSEIKLTVSGNRFAV